MPDQEKDREKIAGGVSDGGAATAVPASKPGPDDGNSQYFFGEALVGFDPAEITGQLIVIEGMDGSGRSTQITLLQEWLESEGFAVTTSGLRRSNLVGRDIDHVRSRPSATPPTTPASRPSASSERMLR